MKMAYLIIWYLKYVSLSFIISAWPPRPFSCFGFVRQWVWELWTWRGMPAPQLSAGSATPRLWKEGAACGYHAPTVSVTAIRTVCALEGAFRFTPHFVFICLCDTLNATYCTSGKHDHYDYSSSSRKLNIFYCSRWNERHLLFYVSCGLQIETSSFSVLQHGAMKHHSKCSLWRSCRMWSLVSCPISGNFGYLMLMAAFLVR